MNPVRTRYLYGTFATLLLLACSLPTEFTDYIDERTAATNVVFVNCGPLTFSISLGTPGDCHSLNADSTLIEGLLPRWKSSCPACILVKEDGSLLVGTVPMVGVIISASGPNGVPGFSQPLDVVP